MFNSRNDADKKFIFSLSRRILPTKKQIKQFKYFLSPREKKIIIISILLIVLSVAWLFIRVAGVHFVKAPKHGGEYTEGLIGSIQYLNPILCQANDVDRDMSRLIFSGLFKVNINGELENDLISNYIISDDKKTYVFTLKKGVLWHDKTKLSTNDIGFTLHLIQNVEFSSPLYKTFQGVGFEKISDNSFKLILPEPFGPFLSTLTFGIMPEHLWQAVNPENANLSELNKKPIGTGPFKYKSFKKDSAGYIKQYNLVVFKDYYSTVPYIDKISFKLFPDSDLAFQALKNNQIDGVSYVSQSNLKTISDSNNFNIYNFNMPQYSALFFNPKKQALLKDENIRKALYLSIDKTELAQEIGTEREIAYGPLDFIIPPGEDEYDIKKSAEILKEAGWAPEDDVLKKDEQEFELTITSVDNDEYISILQYVKKQWSKLGIVTNLEIIPRQKIASQIIEPREYEILLFGQILSYDPDPYPFWHSSQTKTGLNLSIFANLSIDESLESARRVTSFEERLKKYQDFQNVLKQENLAIFLFRPTYYYPLNNRISGVDTKVIYLPADRFFNINNWYIKTKKILKFKEN